MKAQKRIFTLTSIAAAVVSAMAFVPTASVAEEIKSTQDKMVVVSSRAPKAISEIPGTVWYVDSETIEREYRGGKSLGEILAIAVPSLDVATEGRTNYGQNLRGRAMLVMIDGVTLQSSRQISRNLDAIDPFNIDRIEVLSGSTSIYGAGATGGVINIITKKSQSEELEFESYVSGRSGFNTSDDFDYKMAQSISGGNDRLQARASVVYGETQGFYDADGTIVTPDISQGSLQFNTLVDTLLTMGIQISETKQLNLLAQYYDNQQDSPYGLYIKSKNDIEVRDGFESDRQQGTERIMLGIAYSNTAFFSHQLLAEFSYRKEDLTFTPYYQSASQQTTDVISLKAALSKNFERFQLVYGVDAYVDQFTSNQALFDPVVANASGQLINRTYATVGRYANTDVTSIAAFVQGDYALTDDWSLQGGYRYQYMNNEIGDFVGAKQQKAIAAGNGTSADAVPGGETDYTIGLFNLGTLYKLNHESQLWANFSQGFDLADPAKWYGQGDYSNTPDADGHYTLNKSINVNDSKLSGIKTNSFEVGYRLDKEALSLQTAAYYSESDKSITYDKNSLLIKEIEDKNRVYGLEAMLSYWLTDAVQVGGYGHYVKSEKKIDNEWKDISIGSASTSKAGSWIGWYESDFALKLQSQTMFDYTDADDNTLNGYTTFDFVGSYQLPVGSLGFGISNLLNKEYTTIWGQRAQNVYSSHYAAEAYDYKGRGRTFTLNYQVKY
ncbi:TonB-dependent receptor [Vibrio aestuarianus]|uniref:TonB-dependent receptor n=1 Tax=Vibrio aestuarianus TaxID=28171 RepID=UPI00237C9E6F|nr:TonB-dependent receptor [Vibrio aestuarianus]MDE1349455.1 TonB-dependent receptor [Vibrio aestuarianus]